MNIVNLWSNYNRTLCGWWSLAFLNEILFMCEGDNFPLAMNFEIRAVCTNYDKLSPL